MGGLLFPDSPWPLPFDSKWSSYQFWVLWSPDIPTVPTRGRLAAANGCGLGDQWGIRYVLGTDWRRADRADPPWGCWRGAGRWMAGGPGGSSSPGGETEAGRHHLDAGSPRGCRAMSPPRTSNGHSRGWRWACRGGVCVLSSLGAGVCPLPAAEGDAPGVGASRDSLLQVPGAPEDRLPVTHQALPLRSHKLVFTVTAFQLPRTLASSRLLRPLCCFIAAVLQPPGETGISGWCLYG